MTFILVFFFAGAFNVFMDPLGVFGSPRVPRLNAIKPYLDHHRELSRYERARRMCSRAGFFGNSRAEIGFDPESPALASHGLSAFNHAIPGTGINTAYRQFIWLEAVDCLPKTFFLGVEFFDFLGGTMPNPLPTLQTDPTPQRDSRFYAESVFSIAGLRDSVATLLLQQSRYPAISTERGFNPFLNYIPEVRQSGHYVLFRQRAEESVHNWSRKHVRIRPEAGIISDDEAVLDALAGAAVRSGGVTYIIIYPYHAQIRLILERLGMGGVFAQWKRIIVAIAERHSEHGKVEVWDFSGIAPETLEAIPAQGDRQTELAYYWEAGHFKKELGDKMLARMLGEPGDFGIRLDSGNIDRWLAEDRSRVQALLASPSELVREIDALVERRAQK